MFLAQTIKKNQALIEQAFVLHRNGTLRPDTYLIDVDTVLSNAKGMLAEAGKQGVKLFFMLKQLGRNPYLAKRLVELGFCGAVCVDYKEAQTMMAAGIPIGNVGHLVQIPDALIDQLVAYQPELITVYSYDKIQAIDSSCRRQGLTQEILLRVSDPEDAMYSGQTAGFMLADLPELVRNVRAQCSHVRIAGVTSFPCFLYDEQKDDIRPANNLYTI